MRTVRKFTVIPSLPEKLEPLRRLAYNLWWCWSHDAVSLFQRMDRDLWETTGHNPVRVLGAVKQERLNELIDDEGFLSHMQRVTQQFEQYLKSTGWFDKTHPDDKTRIAYFTAEYGLTESVPIYSGGLGILAGDHLKSSSDLGLPLVGVGLLYRVGYFRQYLNVDGWQQELYPENDFYNMPLELVADDHHQSVTITVDVAGRPVQAQIWRLQVGRIPLYLLDTNLEQNHPSDREITAQLYGGDLEMRIRQEILLGIGGQRALEVLGIEPTICHMNEGHSAFQALERIRRAMKHHRLEFHEARLATAAGNIFTTHTPVPAGNDMFPPHLVEKYLANYWPQLGLGRDEFLALGRINAADGHEPFCMTVLALRLAAYSNGVSKLHGAVSRKMWTGVWPEVSVDEVPIHAITNGIHTKSWVSRDMAALYDRYLGPRWREFGAANVKVWERTGAIPDEELWRTHERLRARLVAFARNQLRQQLIHRGAPQSEIDAASEVLDPEALTIGFARRFATYKRATLLFRDLERLKRILGDHNLPLQIIVAGKAHPLDNAGKDLIRTVIHHARDPILRRRIVFLEDYSISLARHLVQGVDIWLNTPRRPMEASGTSGMKCPPNAGLNISIPDGWWPEADQGDNGWSIGKGEDYTNHEYQDDVESHALYDLLEKEVIPLFYERTRDGLPKEWIGHMKASIRTVCPVYNTDRMVSEYTERFYLPAAQRSRTLEADKFLRARQLAVCSARVRGQWPRLAIRSVEAATTEDLEVGAALRVSAVVYLGELKPEEVTVQIYHGLLDAHGEIQGGSAITMGYMEALADGDHSYSGAIPCRTSGQHGYALRILPAHPDLVTPFVPSLIRWG
jgi:glycogen phosphorylase